MISLRQFAAALYGVWLLLKLDARALAYFDKTPGGFARSFLPAVVLSPLSLAHAMLLYDTHTTKLALGPYLIVEVLSYILSCVAFPFVMLYVTQMLGRESRYFGYMVPYNWFQLPVGLAFLPLAILTDFTDAGTVAQSVAGVINLLVLSLFFTYGAFIARLGLQVTLGTAIGVVILDLLLGLLTRQVVSRI